MATEIEIEAMDSVTTAERDRTRVMDTMILANESISRKTTSGLLGGSPRFQHFSFSTFSSLRWGKARHLHLTQLRLRHGKRGFTQHLQQLAAPAKHFLQHPSFSFPQQHPRTLTQRYYSRDPVVRLLYALEGSERGYSEARPALLTCLFCNHIACGRCVHNV